MINRFFEISREKGLKVAVTKAFKYAPVIVLKRVGQAFFDVNSQRYWDYRLMLNWSNAGGGAQTKEFAESFVENVDLLNMDFDSILDFGCALGDSSLVFRELNNSLEIYLWDLSNVGLSRALQRNHNCGVMRWTPGKKVDLVYCSNVIEHVLDTKALLDELCAAAQKWVCIQAPYREFHTDGARITPNRPNGEHIWTIDDEFIAEFLNLPIFSKTHVIKGNAPTAWPFGEQVYFIGRLHEGV